MDTLVASYTQPAFQDEGCPEQEHQELIKPLFPLSLRFIMPPIAQVNLHQLSAVLLDADVS